MWLLVNKQQASAIILCSCHCDLHTVRILLPTCSSAVYRWRVRLALGGIAVMQEVGEWVDDVTRLLALAQPSAGSLPHLPSQSPLHRFTIKQSVRAIALSKGLSIQGASTMFTGYPEGGWMEDKCSCHLGSSWCRGGQYPLVVSTSFSSGRAGEAQIMTSGWVPP